jgi:phospholipid-binding lipoprotein MlaA
MTRRGWVVAVALATVVLGGGSLARAEEQGGEHDPWEPFNRAMFSFNDHVDRWVLEPVAKGYDFVTPDPLQQCVSNFFQNLKVPINSVNDLLQWKPVDAASDVGRFVTNTTVGLAGFLDPATFFGLVRHDEDFGQTLGVWGVPAGPYVVWPLYGASTVRDTGGSVVDTAMSITPFFVESYVTIGARVAETVNARSLVLEDVQHARDASFDFYTFVRNAYLQRRDALIRDEKETPRAADDNLYFPDEKK